VDRVCVAAETPVPSADTDNNRPTTFCASPDPRPADPLKARFMAFNGGHGIDRSEYGTIGHTASHGCMR